MPGESNTWQLLRKLMSQVWDASRHEDVSAKGIPDVSFGSRGTHGWIELKFLKDWPKRANTIVKLGHFSLEQKNFLVLRGMQAGHCFMLLRVGRAEWLLYDHTQVKRIGFLTRFEMLGLANRYWAVKPTAEEFLHAITS